MFTPFNSNESTSIQRRFDYEKKKERVALEIERQGGSKKGGVGGVLCFRLPSGPAMGREVKRDE
jgi:hypothetical protein